MVLFVFEGKKPELKLFDVIDRHFLNVAEEKIVSVFGTNLFKLYEEVKRDDAVRTLDILKLWLKDNNTEEYTKLQEYKARDFTEIYLFFDYDIHAATSYLHLEPVAANQEIAEMLALFADETEHGKLYISYPMVEAYLCTKQMPDDNFCNYTYPISSLTNFKDYATTFSVYTQDQFTTARTARSNWKEAIRQNVAKANFLCTGHNKMPADKNDISQNRLFEQEVRDYVVPNSEVSVLCGLPLFVYEYLRADLFAERVLAE